MLISDSRSPDRHSVKQAKMWKLLVVVVLLFWTWTSSALVRWKSLFVYFSLTSSSICFKVVFFGETKYNIPFLPQCCRISLKQMNSIRTQLRTSGILEEFLKDHHPDMFSRRYVQCFPPGVPSLQLGRSREKIYNFMDVRN